MKVVVAGDFCPQNRVASLLEQGDFQSVFGEFREVVSEADYAIINLECPVVKDSERPILKQGPNLSCSSQGIKAIKWAGFNGVTLANNHFYDYGDDGVRNTLEMCRESTIDTVGGGMNLCEASNILFKHIGDRILAIINCCEHEFSIASDEHGGSNPLDPVRQYYAIKKAQSNADIVLLIIHGGHEHFQLPSVRMVETYRFFIDAGADAIINHHQHCVSGYELYNGKPIFYGLGNFCFDGNRSGKEIWNEGYVVSLTFTDKVSFEIVPYYQCRKSKPSIELMQGKDLSSFYKRISELNAIIADRVRLEQEIQTWYKEEGHEIGLVLTPYCSRVMRGLWRRGFLPSFLPKRKSVELLNMVKCESHHDSLVAFLNNKVYE